MLTPRFCDDVIAYANEQKEVMARTTRRSNGGLMVIKNYLKKKLKI
jgi:hypothetical protein